MVAGEVRALAQRSADTAEEIKGLIDSSVRHVADLMNDISAACMNGRLASNR